MKFTHRLFAVSVAASAALVSGVAFAQAGQTVKIALIDPISGPMANIGEAFTKVFQLEIDRLNTKGNANNPGGVKFELVPFDNKMSPQESLNVLKTAIDQGIRFIA